MKTARLKHLASVVAGQAPPGHSVLPLDEAPNDLPFIQGNGEFGVEHPVPRLACAVATKVAASGDVLVSVRAPVGALNIADAAVGIGRGVAAVKGRRNVLDQRFLWWFMHEARDSLHAVSAGSTYRAVTGSDIGGLMVPVWKVEQQRRIAAFLDRESERIETVQNVIERTMTAVGLAASSAFARHPIVTEAPRVRLRFALSGIEQGWSPECEQRPADPKGWAVMKAGAVNYGVFRPEEHKALPIDVVPRPRYELRLGDLVMSRANTRELAGSAAVVTTLGGWRLLMCDKLYRLHLDQRVAIPDFIALAINSREGRDQIEALTSGASGSMQNISQDIVRGLLLPRPSIAEQRMVVEDLARMSYRATRVSQCGSDLRSALLNYREALIHEAVTGKLDVSRISESEMDERLHAATENRLDEVVA